MHYNSDGLAGNAWSNNDKQGAESWKTKKRLFLNQGNLAVSSWPARIYKFERSFGLSVGLLSRTITLYRNVLCCKSYSATTSVTVLITKKTDLIHFYYIIILVLIRGTIFFNSTAPKNTITTHSIDFLKLKTMHYRIKTVAVNSSNP